MSGYSDDYTAEVSMLQRAHNALAAAIPEHPLLGFYTAATDELDTDGVREHFGLTFNEQDNCKMLRLMSTYTAAMQEVTPKEYPHEVRARLMRFRTDRTCQGRGTDEKKVGK